MSESPEPPVSSAEGPTLAEAVAAHPFLQDMSASDLELLTQCATFANFREGEWIFREDDPANRFYLIQTGQVALQSNIRDRGRLLIEMLGPGDVLGWSWLFPPNYWRFDARATTPVDALFFHGTRLRAECESNHVFGFQLMKRMNKVIVERLQSERKRLVQLAESGQIEVETD
ncbi:MAG TPA: cyclic nucleotide-binding domain-containing protein [Candidatus Limnocylindria bacterium]|jgi:CRP-like cAMP-binding protein|nr:cyclic nucleotide-binding domain-containing protein [Candidatus Limnocylindria bacterium]